MAEATKMVGISVRYARLARNDAYLTLARSTGALIRSGREQLGGVCFDNGHNETADIPPDKPGTDTRQRG